MITTEMVEAAAKAMFAKTSTSKHVQWDLLPRVAQHEMKEIALAALNAAEELRVKPRVNCPPPKECEHTDMHCPPGKCDL